MNNSNIRIENLNLAILKSINEHPDDWVYSIDPITNHKIFEYKRVKYTLTKYKVFATYNNTHVLLSPILFTAFEKLLDNRNKKKEHDAICYIYNTVAV